MENKVSLEISPDQKMGKSRLRSISWMTKFSKYERAQAGTTDADVAAEVPTQAAG